MRILAIHLHNLNSLAGRWSIDFSAPEYVASGIFAITGPTGAGKSTILDAICLALYGRTPRLRQVTRSQNEIMSRRTGACAAEVEFETSQGRYRCHWSQHRARRRPDGQLQQPRHELVDAVTGRVLETRMKAVAEQVERLTGMDFERFTRSMLLAQGDFAAFLQAGPDERAPILEQITGTAVYSRISILVHERRAAERARLAVLEAGLGGLQPLAPEQAAALRRELDTARQRAERMERALERASRGLAWLETLAELRRQLAQCRRDQEELAQRRQEAGPALERLARARRAAELDSLYAELRLLRQEQEQDRAALAEGVARQRQQARERRRLAATFGQAEQALQACRQRRQEEGKSIRRVRELDVQCTTAGQELEQRRAALAGQRQECERQGEALAGMDQRLAACRARLEELADYCDCHHRDGMLVEQLAGIRRQCARLDELSRARARREQEAAAAAAALARAGELRERLERDFRESAQRVAGLQQRRAALEKERAALLQGRTAGFWQQELETLDRRLQALEQAEQVAARIDEQQAALAELARTGSRLAGEHAACRAARVQREKELVLRRKLVSELRQKEELRRRIRDLEEERQCLVPGSPCPLCGSTSHPWARETPVVAEAGVLEREEAALDELTEAAALDAGRQEALEKELAGIREQEAALRARLDGDRRQLVALAAALEVAPEGDGLARAREECAQQRQECRRLLARADEQQQELESVGRALEQEQEARAGVGRELEAARQRQEAAARDGERLRQAVATAATDLEEAWQELGHTPHSPGTAGEPPADLEGLLRELAERQEAWKGARQEQERLDRERAALLAARKEAEKRLRRLKEEVEAMQQEVIGREQALARLREERQELFGSRDPEQEEQRLAGEEKEAAAHLERVRGRLAEQDRDLHALADRLRRLHQDVAAREERLQERQGRLEAALAEAGFTDEEAFVRARLQPAAMQELARLEESLQRQEAGLQARAGELALRLATEQGRALTAASRRELAARQEPLMRRRQELQERIGALGAELARDRDLERRRRELLAEVRAQEREVGRWERLHELIGSADGRKFRVFAQGLTLDLLLDQANRQLRKMQDRYLLVRADHSLELGVIDNYQAGVIRSTSNLSGGESFIVSLALALGLSAMASRNVRVDSLFLDEGFGTLDEDALDMALQTLAGLRREGKLIGIISHVPALRERISTRIRVEPGPGGRSRITGPGCARQGS